MLKKILFALGLLVLIVVSLFWTPAQASASESAFSSQLSAFGF